MGGPSTWSFCWQPGRLGRVSVRLERQRVEKDIEATEKEGNFSEDDKFRAKEELQKLVNDINNRLEEAFNKKEADIMTV
jgi:ribosome recycling factor